MKIVAIKVKTTRGERYFYGIGKGWRVQTAWSLAGAKLFRVGTDELKKVAHTLRAKNKQFEVVEIAEFVGGAR
jgi:hypothetical protein